MFFKKTRSRLKEVVQSHAAHITAPVSEFRRRYQRIQRDSRADPPGSFAELLDMWNCTAEDIPYLHRQLQIRLLIFILVGLILGGFLLAQGKVIGALILAPPVLVGILTSLWRLHLIRNKCYLPFKKWFFSKGSGEGGGEDA